MRTLAGLGLGAVLAVTAPAARADEGGVPVAPGNQVEKGLVPLRLTAYKPDAAYAVTVRPEAMGVSSFPCTTPCSIGVPAGPAKLHAVVVARNGELVRPGDQHEMDLDILVPASEGLVRIQYHNRSLLIAGAVLIPTGVVMASTMWLLQATCRHSSSDYACPLTHTIVWPVLGTALLSIGIPFVVMGRPPPDDANRVLSGRDLLARASFGVTPLRGGAGVGVGFAF